MNTSPTPPHWADRLLTWFCAPHRLEEVQGDLYERYSRDVRVVGVQTANWRYWLNMLRFMRPFAVKRQPSEYSTPFLLNPDMLRNYLITTLRSLRRNPVYTAIYLTGLAVALAFGLLTFTFVHHEWSFDRAYPDADRLYRFESTDLFDFDKIPARSPLNLPFLPTEIHRSFIFPVVFSQEIRSQLPELQDVLRVTGLSDGLVRHDSITVHEEAIVFADTNYFRFFGRPLIIGQPDRVLAGLTNAVISETLRQKLFGPRNPIGQPIQYESQLYTVSGVMQNPDDNTSFPSELILRVESQSNYQSNLTQRYNNSNVYTLARLLPSVSLDRVRAKLKSLGPLLFKQPLDDRRNASLPNSPQIKPDDFLLTIRPLTDTHFSFSDRWERAVSPTNVYLLIFISLLILLVAGLNYITISLAKLGGRLQEVGVRKVVGAVPGQLAGQLWIETVLVVSLASLLGILIAVILLPTFNNLTDRQFQVLDLLRLPNLAGLLAIGLGISTLVGVYPAYLFARFRPTLFLGQNRTYRINPTLIQGMMTTQFTISLVLVMAALTMYQQLAYVRNRDLGLNKELVLKVKNLRIFDEGVGPVLYDRMLRYKNQNADILSVAGSAGGYGEGGFNRNGTMINGQQYWVLEQYVDYNFFSLLGMSIAQGRSFSPVISSDTASSVRAVVINKTLAKLLGRDLIFNKPLDVLNGRTVVGVVNDHNIEDLTKAIAPATYKLASKYYGTFYLKLTPGNVAAKVARIARDWPPLADGQPFEYSFLDQDLENQYRDYQRWTTLTQLATAIALLIAALGLFGLSGIHALNRLKEVGIRKVMGATTQQLWTLLNRRTLTLVAIAFGLAVPLSVWLMNRWLANFAYHISIGWELVMLTGLLGFLTALTAVSYHSLRAALMNPVESLRSE
ncbi:permease prefix domain 2-containing transporter [Spirosoma arcticum]